MEVALNVGSYLYETPPHHEDGSTQTLATYYACVSFGSPVVRGYRCFAHFKRYDTEEEAQCLVDRIKESGKELSVAYCEASPHWRPDPYGDRSLQERFEQYAEEEEFERRYGSRM